MSSSVEVASSLAVAPELASEGNDHHLIALWLHGRSENTVRAYQADVERTLVRAGKPLARVTLSDLQKPNGEGGQITVLGKGGKTRSIQLPGSVWDPLLKLRKKTEGFLQPVAVLTTGRYLHARPKESSSRFLPL